MNTIDWTHVTDTGLQQYHLCTEASCIGLRPGEWPRLLPTVIGNKQPFVLHHRSDCKVVYRQAFGVLQLEVYND